MGRAIVRDPQVFLFDEPLSNLDAKLRIQMRTEIKELHQLFRNPLRYLSRVKFLDFCHLNKIQNIWLHPII